MTVALEGLGMLFSVEILVSIVLGLLLGIVVGAIPGLTPATGLVLCTPLTYNMGTLPAIILLLGIYCGGTYGGSITAILIRTPGTPAAACTVLDGYPMAEKGQARKALDAALIASVIGGLFSALVLLMLAPQLAKLTIKFSPVEYFMIAVFGLSVIVSVSGDSLIKGFLATGLGLFISSVGTDAQSATIRYTFGIVRLRTGIQIAVILVGLFGLSELLIKGESRQSDTKHDKFAVGGKNTGATWKDILKYPRTLLTSSLIGAGVGALPGTGAALSAFLAYNSAKKRSSHPETFGKGELEGIVAAESANNGVTGATLIPTLTLGIPGDGCTAILLGALTLHGLVPGPQLFQTQGKMIYAMMFSLIIINAVMFLQGKFLLRFFAKVSDIPYPILGGLVAFFCFVGSYAASNSYLDIYICIIFGVVGYLFHKWDFPAISLMLGLVLGDLFEQNLRRSIIMAKGDYTIFFTRPISLVFFLLTVFSIGRSLHKSYKANKAISNN